MSKEQFWTLNLVGGTSALLIPASLALGQINSRLHPSALTRQTQLNQARQVQKQIVQDFHFSWTPNPKPSARTPGAGSQSK